MPACPRKRDFACGETATTRQAPCPGDGGGRGGIPTGPCIVPRTLLQRSCTPERSLAAALSAPTLEGAGSQGVARCIPRVAIRLGLAGGGWSGKPNPPSGGTDVQHQ